MSKSAKMSARERIEALLDENSFVEIGAMITKRNTDFNLDQSVAKADGVITGYGVVDSNLVYVYSQDPSELQGSVGEMHAKKIANLYDMAMKMGAPIIGLVDCAGFRLEEAVDGLAGFGDIYKKQVMASGVIPQISAILGSCGGGVAVSSVLSDFTFMERNNGKLFVNSPNAIKGNFVEKCDTSLAEFHEESNMVDFILDSEEEVLGEIRKLISILPANYEDCSCVELEDDMNRMLVDMKSKFEDPSKAFTELSDQHQFVEVKKGFAKEMVTGFVSLNGATIGVVANRVKLGEESFEAALTTKGCEKAERFVKFCDAFEIPILTFTNVKGYAASMEEERTVAYASGKLTYAFANATVPKVNVIIGNAIGSAYLTMNSKHIGADLVFALPSAKVGVMEASVAKKVMLDQDDDGKDQFVAIQDSVELAAKRGYVDTVIEAESMRKHLIYAFDMLATKREVLVSKKHGTV